MQVKARRGHGVAIVALARKMLGVLYHLLVSGEVFLEEGLVPRRRQRVIWPRDLSVLFDEALGLLAEAGYVKDK
ncbi:MAG: hypothetical protein LBQ98_08950 [Nitrososphaerota archaeon]|nr:hypothetical protein [Nitrososphaerota archaeon]